MHPASARNFDDAEPASTSDASSWDVKLASADASKPSSGTPTTSGSGLGAQSENNRTGSKPAKSCKGCLYFSNMRAARGGKPLCIGLAQKEGDQDIPVHDHSKDRPVRQDFKYACVGYSLWEDRASDSSREVRTQMPAVFCMGLEFVATKDGQEATVPNAPAGTTEGDGRKAPPFPSPHPPTTLPTMDFYHRFQRSAGRLADHTLSNMQKIGSKIKEGVSNVVNQDKDRPKP